MYPNDTEAVFDIDEHAYLYVEVLPDKAGIGFATLFLEEYDAWLAGAASRGVEPAEIETYDNGVAQGDLPGPGRQRDRVRRGTRLIHVPREGRHAGLEPSSTGRLGALIAHFGDQPPDQ